MAQHMQNCLWQCLHALHAGLGRSPIGPPQISSFPNTSNLQHLPHENVDFTPPGAQNPTVRNRHRPRDQKLWAPPEGLKIDVFSNACLNPLFGAFFSVLGGSWGTLGAFWTFFGRPWESPNRHVVAPGRLFERLWSQNVVEVGLGGCLGTILVRFWCPRT